MHIPRFLCFITMIVFIREKLVARQLAHTYIVESLQLYNYLFIISLWINKCSQFEYTRFSFNAFHATYRLYLACFWLKLSTWARDKSYRLLKIHENNAFTKFYRSGPRRKRDIRKCTYSSFSALVKSRYAW